MSRWLERKAHDFRHAMQELRAGDAIDRLRSGVRTTIVGGRPPGDDAVVPVPMGIERVLRKAAADQRFRARLMSDRTGALERSGLELSDSERAILLAIPAEHLQAMIAQLAPRDPARRSLFRRLAAAAGIALFGATTQTGCPLTQTRGEDASIPEGTEGIRPELPRDQTAGIRPDTRSGTHSGSGAATPPDIGSPTAGVRPGQFRKKPASPPPPSSRPQTAGETIELPPGVSAPEHPAADAPPKTRGAQADVPPGSAAGATVVVGLRATQPDGAKRDGEEGPR